MRIADATNETFNALTESGTVVVAFYTSACSGYRDAKPPEQPSSVLLGATWKPKRTRYPDAIRKAIKSATWGHDRKIRVVFVNAEECRATCDRLNVFAFATFWILKDGERIADMPGIYEGGHRDSERLAREQFARWLSQHLPSPE
jgi:hypothetical protein